jgi:hypothetical protein
MLWVVMLLACFFILSSCHCETCGPTHSVTNCSHLSCGILEGQSFVSMRKQEIMLTCLQMRHSCLIYIYAHVAWHSHTCFCTVLCSHDDVTHPEVVAILWQKRKVFIVKKCCMAS